MSLWQHAKRLNVQLVAFLLLALLPLGSVAIYQTNRVATQANENANLALLTLTERAAQAEQILIERAVGAARLFGLMAPDLMKRPAECAQVLSQFVQTNPEYSFVGVLPRSGVVDCSSYGQRLDFRDYPNFESTMETGAATIVVNRTAPTTGESVFVVSEPFSDNGRFEGFVSISIPQKNIPETRASLQQRGLIELITFSNDGTLLTSRESVQAASAELPKELTLESLANFEATSFRAENIDGTERRYTVVPIEGTPATILAVWSLGSAVSGGVPERLPPSIFPILMLFASLAVAMLAMHTLVLRHLQRLGRDMERFASDRRIARHAEEAVLVPLEIEKLSQNFSKMSTELLNDEAILEDSLRDKEVLIKEIHHRVKNNLQLISSIMNIQIRSAKYDETRDALRRLQDRVLSLATIHRDLYQLQDAGRVNAGALVSEIVDKSVEIALTEGANFSLTSEIEPLKLFPDQAVPLSLLVAEAAANAMKYVGASQSDQGAVEVSLAQKGDTCRLVFINTIGNSKTQESTGLGSTLMNAFAMQLGGKLETDQDAGRYTLTVAFKALEFQPEVRSY